MISIMDADPARTFLKMTQCVQVATDAHLKITNSLLAESYNFLSTMNPLVDYMAAVVHGVDLREQLQTQGGAHFLKNGLPPSYVDQAFQSAVKTELLQELQPYREQFASVFGVKPSPVSWTDRIAHALSGRAL